MGAKEKHVKRGKNRRKERRGGKVRVEKRG